MNGVQATGNYIGTNADKTPLRFNKTADFAKEHPVFVDKSLHYPLLKGLGFLLLIGACVVTIILTSPIGLYFIPVFIAGVIYFLPNLREYKKRLVSEVILSIVRFITGKENWMHEVLDVKGVKLFLGGIPLKNYDYIEEFKKKKITKVVSLIESWEQTSVTFGGEPVLNSDYRKARIDQTLIETPDYMPVPRKELKIAVESIHQAIEAGKNVYVHCKAGVGRSATAVVCYLLTYQRAIFNIPQNTKIGIQEINYVIKYVTGKREQVCPVIDAVFDYLNFI